MTRKLLTVFVSVIVALAVASGCRTPEKPVLDLSQGQKGEIAYQVPKGIDLSGILAGKTAGAAKETIIGRLMMPENAKGKVPAVIIMHASGGVFQWREITAAHVLNQKGIAAFIPYSFESRGISGVSQTSGTGITFGMRLADAYAALNLLGTHPGIDPARIGIMGYSSGGIVSLLAGDEAVREKLGKNGLSFAAHVNVYTSVMFSFEKPRPTPAPMLFLMGEKDDLCPTPLVLAYAGKLRAAGGKISTIAYPGAYHVFDSNGPVRFFADKVNDGKCRFPILASGMLLDPATGKQFSERDWPKHIGPCSTKGVHFGRDEAAADKYLKDAVSFLNKALD